jgi:hypothetical protein
MRRRFLSLPLALLLALALAASAGAAPKPAELAAVNVGKPRVSTAAGGASILVPVTYPIQLAGERMRLTVRVREPGAGQARTWKTRVRLSAGPLRSPDRRQRFTFVHRVGGGAALAALLRRGAIVIARAGGGLDLDGDGRPETAELDAIRQQLSLGAPGRRLCSSVPALRARPGAALSTRLPSCSGGEVNWRIAAPPANGRARIKAGKLLYNPDRGYLGSDSVRLSGSGTGVPVRITVGAGAEAPVVRALGDSVSAGFGYYEDASLMELSSLLECKPGESSYDDACSSNSKVRSNKVAAVEYASDYGLANNVSWTAQWANEHGVTDFKNFAVSGSEPSDWYGKGQFAKTTAQLQSEDPDYVLLTLGANPLLSDMLFGAENMGCAIYADIFGGYEECLERAFAEIKLRANLKTIYEDLLADTSARIFVMQYHLSIPATALAYGSTQIAEMGVLLNREIEAVANSVSKSRITVVAPPHFDVGVSLEPVYPASFTCSYFEYPVDGPSVQSRPSQVELLLDHPFSFCKGPPSGPPWVISGDTGIHPSATGYAQMAAQVPAPR